MQSLLKTSFRIIIALAVSSIFIYAGRKIQYYLLFQNVNTTAQSEFNKIQLPNELIEEQAVMRDRCYYDSKVKAKRCNTRYTSYYVADENPIIEFQKVDKYLINLGWEHSSSLESSTKELTDMYEKGYLPFEIYEQDNPYKLDLHMTFYGEKDRGYAYSDSNKNVISILDRYSNDNRSIYSISISSDIIN